MYLSLMYMYGSSRLSRDCGQDLSVAKEEEIFDAVQAWAAAACDRGEARGVTKSLGL